MAETIEIKKMATIDSEIKPFADSLPYWAKFLANKILSGLSLEESDYEIALEYFKEDNGLKEKTERPEIDIELIENSKLEFKSELFLKEIKNIQGVNALAENQSIELSPNVTVVYGANGSGKTGYIRLFNNAFFSRSNDKDIIPNIKLENGHKSPSCEFIFNTNNSSYPLKYPENKEKLEWQQFGVFDCRSVLVHLNEKKEFVFRPRALDFFSELISAYEKIKAKLKSEIGEKNSPKDYSAHFDGDSEIKKLINELSSKTKINDLKNHTPFSENDKENRTKLEEQKTDLSGIKKNKDDEIKKLETIQRLIKKLIADVEANNSFFTSEKITEVQSDIFDYQEKKKIANRESIENFKTDKIKNVGSIAWRNFIKAAEVFAKNQGKEKYPDIHDHCLLCQQPLNENEIRLIKSYWEFIKSKAEEDAKKSKKIVDQHKIDYEEIEFDLLPKDNVLTEWLKINYFATYEKITTEFKTLEKLCKDIISDCDKVELPERKPIQIETSVLTEIETELSKKITELAEKNVDEELATINVQITYLNHREKLSTHFDEIGKYINNMKWVAKAESKISLFNPQTVTKTGKRLSKKYFGDAYQKKFTEECNKLDAHFDIELFHSGSYGSSYREFKIKDRLPSQILSEGEQRAISLADFLTEIQLSGINKGIIFDDPVNSLDEERKSVIAERLVKESENRQVLIFTHDLVFLSSLIGHSEELDINYECHWIEKLNGKPGVIHLKNTPSYEKSYKNSGKAQKFYNKAIKGQPEERESHIKNGFAALRTSYEALVIFELFGGVVQRFNERVSIDSLAKVHFNEEIRDEIKDSFYQCCRYMEGHSHSDKYAFKKPNVDNLKGEINRFDEVKKKLKELKKNNLN